jgi:hypothetical protein
MIAATEAAWPAQQPWAIGLLRLPGGYQPYAVSARDIERDTAWATRVFRWIGLKPRLPAHLVGAGCDNEILWPYENALIRMNVPFGVAEPVRIDTPRTDMFLRRFRMQAVIGVSGELVDGLLAAGRDLQQLLGDSIVVALPDACASLRKVGIPPWKMVPVGPMVAFETPDGDGARYDQSEWYVEDDGNELLLTSLASRASPFVRLRTGVSGGVEVRPAEKAGERVIITG